MNIPEKHLKIGRAILFFIGLLHINLNIIAALVFAWWGSWFAVMFLAFAALFISTQIRMVKWYGEHKHL